VTEVLEMLQGKHGISLFFGVPTMYVRLLAEAQKTGAPARPFGLIITNDPSGFLTTWVPSLILRTFGG